MSRRIWHVYRPGMVVPVLATASRTRIGAWIAWCRWCREYGLKRWTDVRIERGAKL